MIYVLSDGGGFVMAAHDLQTVRDTVSKHPSSAFVIQRFESARDAPGDAPSSVWVVLYRDIDAVAFVSDSRAKAVAVQKMYIAAGLTYDDPIDCWEQSVGVVSAAAAARLESKARLRGALAGMCLDDLSAEKKLFDAASDEFSPLSTLIRENELVSIQDAICDVAEPEDFVIVDAAAPAAPAAPAADTDCGLKNTDQYTT